jgi:hypothetical protein
MSKESLDIADNIIMDAFSEGMSIKSTQNNKVVENRLRIFGEWIDGVYYLNSKGIEYAMSGCSIGVNQRLERQKEIELLDIETKTFTKKKQKWVFRFAIVSLVLSILSILSQVGLLAMILQWISKIAQWICCMLQ